MIIENRKAIVKSMEELIVADGKNAFSYNITIPGKVTPMVILGKEGMDLPPFPIPISFSFQGNGFVVVDMRAYVSKTKAINVMSISEVTKGNMMATFEFVKFLLTVHHANTPNVFNPILSTVQGMLSKALTGVLKNTGTLSIVEELHVEVLVTRFIAYKMLYLGDYETPEELLRMVNHKTLQGRHSGDLQFATDIIGQSPVISNIDELIEEVKAVTIKLRSLDSRLIYTALSRSYIIPSNTFNTINLLDDLPTAIAVIWSNLTQQLNKRAVFRRAIEKDRGANEIIQTINSMMNNSTV